MTKPTGKSLFAKTAAAGLARVKFVLLWSCAMAGGVIWKLPASAAAFGMRQTFEAKLQQRKPPEFRRSSPAQPDQQMIARQIGLHLVRLARRKQNHGALGMIVTRPTTSPAPPETGFISRDFVSSGRGDFGSANAWPAERCNPGFHSPTKPAPQAMAESVLQVEMQ